MEHAPTPGLEILQTADISLGSPSPGFCLDERGRRCHRCDAPARRDQSAAVAATSPAHTHTAEICYGTHIEVQKCYTSYIQVGNRGITGRANNNEQSVGIVSWCR